MNNRYDSVGTKDDRQKLRVDLVPPSLILGVAQVMTPGAEKYGDRNWERGMAWSRPYAALQRHLLAWWGGEDLDPEWSLSHLKHAACCISFLIEYETTHRDMDDRPKPQEGK